MLGVSIRTRSNVAGSPPPHISNGDSLRTVRTSNGTMVESMAEIDTRAPFQSVKAAVSLFGDQSGSPKGAKPVLRKASTAEERVLEKETHLQWVLTELDKLKEHLKTTEAAKAKAEKELEKANKSLQELTSRLETATESKNASSAASEAAKDRAKRLKEEAISSKARIEEDSQRIEAEYKAYTSELSAAKEEITNIRKEYKEALDLKTISLQKAEEAESTTEANRERMNILSKEIEMVREKVSQVNLATLQAQEDIKKTVSDKEMVLRSNKAAKEEVEKKILALKSEPDQEIGNLEHMLELTTKEIEDFEEQLRNARGVELESLRKVSSELEGAKVALRNVLQEESSLRSSMDSMKQELEQVKKELAEMEEKSANTEKGISEIAAALGKEAENSRHEAEEMKRIAEELKRETEAAINESKETEEKLKAAAKEAEEAKAKARLTKDQMQMSSSSGNDNPDHSKKSSGSKDKIKLSVEEYESLKKKVQEFEKLAQEKVEAAMAEVEASKARAQEAAKSLEASLKEIEDTKAATEDALKKAEMDEAAKQMVENVLRKWRLQEENNVVKKPTYKEVLLQKS